MINEYDALKQTVPTFDPLKLHIAPISLLSLLVNISTRFTLAIIMQNIYHLFES